MKIRVVENVLGANDAAAADNRKLFAEHRVLVVNVMSSPGSGKTRILEQTLSRLSPDIATAVVVGDICTTNDADRLAAGGTPVVQINTEPFGGDCHLGAHVVREAISGFDLAALDLILVENVGNLVCPAEFDIGQDVRCVVLSVAEGEDKPVKYPLMFRICDVALVNKIDLLPHLELDRSLVLENIRSIHADIEIFEVSARTGEGLDAWLGWLEARVRSKKAASD